MNGLKIVVFIFVALYLMVTSFGLADQLIIKGDPNPISGKLVQRGSESIRFRKFGETDVTTFDLASVVSLTETIDEARLRNLNSNDPSEYRDLAEELSACEKDKEARALAIRLYLIAAHQAIKTGDRMLAVSAVCGLKGLGRTPIEERDFGLLRLIHEQRDHLPLSFANKEVTTSVATGDDVAKAKFLQAIMQIRKGNKAGIQAMLNDEAVRREALRWGEVCSLSEILSMMENNRLSMESLSKLLSLELALRNNLSPQESSKSNSWFEQSAQLGKSWVRLPTLSTVTEFDPTKVTYSNGEWK